MNKPIRTISIFCMFLFLALMANATYLQFWEADDLNKDPNNRRIIEAAYSRERGAILVGRDPVAESVPVDDQYKFQRTYSLPFMYAPITGFFSFYTQTGLERTQNEVLSGEDPRLFVTRLVDLLSNQDNQGGSVELTIDPDAQQAAYDGLANNPALPGDVEGSVVAIEPATGKILAMVSLPSYDPNKLASHDLSSVDDVYQRLLADPTEPLINRATSKRLPPGSTFKLVTAAAAIENGLYEGSDDVPAGAIYDVPQTSSDIGNEGRTQCNPAEVSFSTAMEWSCNTTFARMANDLGAEKMLEQAEAFGFNSDYLEDLPQAQSVYPEDPNEPETAQTGIGQFEVAATPLQMAMVSAAIANGGTVMRPYLVNKVQSADYQDLEQTEPSEFSRAISSSTADQLTELMVNTVELGTANPASIAGVDVAGKTGTAQSGIESVPPYAWFTSFAPADNPQVAVAVMIESAPGIDRGEIAGGQLGGPIAKAVMEAILGD
jgi:peptidoglycan glycosyltransferase